jgi:HlyD family secretion protein
MKKILFRLFLAALVVGIGVVVMFLFHGDRESNDVYRTAAVKKGDIKSTVASTGKLAPLNTVEVGSQVSGNIKEIYADYNSVVKKDQVIALIDPEIYAGQVSQSKAQLQKAKMSLLQKQEETAAARAAEQNARAHLFAARATLKEAERNYGRQSGLAKRLVVAGAELDSALARRDNALGEVEMAEAQVSTCRAQIEKALAVEKWTLADIAEKEANLLLAETRLNYCTIRSPIDGIVITRKVDVGQTVAATLQSPVLFTIAEDLTRMQVEVDVSEADVGQIKHGQVVEFTVDAFPDKVFKASVRQVRNSATSIQNVVTYKIIADVNNDSLLLRPEMTANVTIVLATVGDTLKVPNSALRFKPPGKIGEAGEQTRPPIPERPFYKRTVEALGLDPEQAAQLVYFIARGEQKLRAVYSLPEADRNLEQAWRGFFVQVFTDLHTILREDQYEKFAAYRTELKKERKKRAGIKGRQATVYAPGEKGPVAVQILAGITDESETQVIGGDLNEGDKVIIGLSLASDGTLKRPGNLFSKMFKKGQ